MDVGLSNARHHCAAHDLKRNKRETAQDEKKCSKLQCKQRYLKIWTRFTELLIKLVVQIKLQLFVTFEYQVLLIKNYLKIPGSMANLTKLYLNWKS